MGRVTDTQIGRLRAEVEKCRKKGYSTTGVAITDLDWLLSVATTAQEVERGTYSWTGREPEPGSSLARLRDLMAK